MRIIGSGQCVDIIIPQIVVRVPIKFSRKQIGPKGMTTKERKIFELVMAGKVRKEIANELNITVRTVAFHLTSIYRKAGVRTSAELFSENIEI